jgi:Protein of unknown function (DUF4031)
MQTPRSHRCRLPVNRYRTGRRVTDNHGCGCVRISMAHPVLLSHSGASVDYGVTVYVDDYKASFGRMKMCHMVADTEEELHAMADAIGVARKWFQQKPSGDHYDIALSKRMLALSCGAREITTKQCAAMCRNRRRTGSLGNPETAIAEMLEHWRHPLILVGSTA